jgi:sugar-specific transcriptional regulator TrmB
MSHISTLQTLGLTEDEAGTYLALLKIGGGNAIALSKEVGVKRTTIYPILKSLHEKGFASTYFHKSKRLYRAEKPDKVAGQYEKRLESFEAIIPELKTIEKQTVSTVGLRFIETKQELERFYTGILVEYKGKSYSAIGSATAWEGIDPDFFQKFRFDRANAKIKTRILLSADSIKASPDDTKLLRDVRVLPKNHTFKSTMDIFDDKILVVNPDQTALAVVIEVPSMVDIFKEMFEMLWEK